MGSLRWDDIRTVLGERASRPVEATLSGRAAVALVLRQGREGIEILFIRRSEHPEDPWSGHMAFPGGRAEPGDANLASTAIRETAEEIGIDLGAEAECLGALDEVQAMARMRPVSLAITPFVFRLQRPVEPRLGAEVRSIHWLPLDDLLGPSRHSTMEYMHQEATLQFPCLRVEELVIWGLTYRMFMSLRERLDSSGAPQTLAGPQGAGH